jgi:hypothetical protein
VSEPGYWWWAYFSPKPSDYTFFDAPAWQYTYYPEGAAMNKSAIVVTYGLDLPEGIKTVEDLADKRKALLASQCDPKFGYKVFLVTVN